MMMMLMVMNDGTGEEKMVGCIVDPICTANSRPLLFLPPAFLSV
jgi:hypothetical protein